MRRRLRPLIWLALTAGISGCAASSQPTSEGRAHAERTRCGQVSDVALPRFVPAAEGDRRRPPLEKTRDLLTSFTDGEGHYVSETKASRDARFWAFKLREGVMLQPLPWNVADERKEQSRLIVWNPTPEEPLSLQNESTLAMLLLDGDAWCSPELALDAGARLRLEPLGLEKSARGELSVHWRSGDDTEILYRGEGVKPAGLAAAMQLDLPLPQGRGSVCLEARGGILGIGEPRLLAPEPEGKDPRPRWVVLLLLDALRADALTKETAAEVSPALFALSRAGRQYYNAVSNGCHTRSAVWPLMMGRDLMRVDPLKRREHPPIQSALTTVYSRGNLFVTHLAEDAGYHSVFLGNNEYLAMVPAFSRFSSHGKLVTGTYDTVTRLPQLMERYGDERVLLVYYVANPHSRAATPKRLVEEFGCSELEGFDECRCQYDARLRHADESVAALEEALALYGLKESTLTVLTSDHGEVLEDGMPLEQAVGSFQGFGHENWMALDYGHGGTCHMKELNVPLVLRGPGLEPRRFDERVSTLDVVPTLAELLDLSIVSRLDGRPLPALEPSAEASFDRTFVSYGFCSNSVLEGKSQLIWWTEGCRVREQGEKELLGYKAELWSNGARVATDRTDPRALDREMAKHESYLRARLPGSAWLIDASRLPPGEFTFTAESGTITDFGPSATIHGLSGIRSVVLDDASRVLRVELDGYRGWFYVAASDNGAPVRVALSSSVQPSPMSFVGALQLPVDILDRSLDPARDRAVLAASAPPFRRSSPDVQLRLWWDPFDPSLDRRDAQSLTDFERVLREWGYIR